MQSNIKYLCHFIQNLCLNEKKSFIFKKIFDFLKYILSNSLFNIF